MSKALALTFALLVLEKFYGMLGDEKAQTLQGDCSKEGCQEKHGRSLLQVRRTSIRTKQPVSGATEPLTDEGFNKIRDLCCSEEMQAFIERMIAKEEMKVCIEGGLAGLVIWYDCANDDLADDFTKLKADLVAAADPANDCPWLGEMGAQCQPAKATCSSFPDAAYPPCGGGDPNTFICCGFANGFQPTYVPVKSKSKIAPWDCKAHGGPIQVHTDADTGDFYNVSMLDLTDKAGAVYKTLFQIPTTRTKPPMDKRMNSVAINPVDGIAYATISITDMKYIVRFDKDKFEFVARIPALGNFSGVYTKDHTYMGAFGQSGTYYFGGSSEPGKGTDMFAVKDIASFKGHKKQNTKKLVVLDLTLQGVSYAKIPISGADIAIANGDFDHQGTVSEWLFLLQYDFTLGIAKIVDSDVTNLAPLKLKTQLSSAADGKRTFGAAWSFMDEVFFSRNNGDGVFHILRDSIDLTALTYMLKKDTDRTAVTHNNDGMSCLDSTPPFRGDCADPEWEVDKVDGQCPKGSHAVAKA